MKLIDLARLDRILAQLAPDDALWLSEAVEPPSRSRARRLALRDAAICQLARLQADQRVTVRARGIERELAAYLAGRWRRERELPALPPDAREHHRLLHEIAHLNCGVPIGWRMIAYILQRTAVEIATTASEDALAGGR